MSKHLFIIRSLILVSSTLKIDVSIGQELGAESTMPYLSPDLTRENLLVGANFASAGVGILNDTGDQFVST